MQNTSNAYKNKLNSGDYEIIYKFKINDNSELEYTDDNILGGRITEAEFSAFGIGNFISRTLEVSFLDDVITVPKRAKIDVSYTIGEAANSWKPKGVFYVDQRQRNESEVSLVAYDAALKSSIPFMPSGTWTQTEALDIYDELIGIIGVGADPATRSMIQANNYVLESAPDIGEDGTTVGEMIGYLAAIYGCNALIDEFENLKFIKPFGDTVGVYSCTDISTSPIVTVDRIKLHTDRDINAEFRYPVVSDEVWDAMTGYIVEGTSIFATQTMANNIGAELVGKTYQGFLAEGVFEDPAIQLGDVVTIEDSDVMVVKRIISFDDDAVELSAPYEEEIESEYPKLTPTQRQIQKEKARRMASVSVLEDQISLKVDTADFEAADASNYASITPYYLQNYGATPSKTDSNWSTTAPQWVSGMHMWTLTEYVTKGGIVSRSNPVDITGATGQTGQAGETGEAGKSPVSFDQYLYASTSADSPTGGSWIHVSEFNLSDYQNDETHHYYIWTKTITTFDDDSTSETEPYLDTYYNNVTTQFDVLNGSIQGTVKEINKRIDAEEEARQALEGTLEDYDERISTVESLETTVTQTASGLAAVTTRVTAVEGELQEQSNYMRWHGDATVPYLEIGQSNASVHTEMRGNAFAVVTNNEDSMVADESGVTARAFKASESVDIGNFRWVDEGSIGFSLI